MWSRGQWVLKHTTPSNSWEDAKWDSQTTKYRALQFSGILISQGTNPITLFLLHVFKLPSWSWPCTLGVIKANSLKGSWYHPKPRIWTVKIMSEKRLQMTAPPLPSKWLTVQFSIRSSTRLCFAAPSWIPTSLSDMSLGESPLCSWRLSCLSSQVREARKIDDSLQSLQSPQKCHWLGACATLWVFREVDQCNSPTLVCIS